MASVTNSMMLFTCFPKWTSEMTIAIDIEIIYVWWFAFNSFKHKYDINLKAILLNYFTAICEWEICDRIFKILLNY